jgi:hypothetical protein
MHFCKGLLTGNKAQDFICCQIDGLTLYKVTFGKVDMYHCQHALANTVLIPSHASIIQHVQTNEY